MTQEYGENDTLEPAAYRVKCSECGEWSVKREYEILEGGRITCDYCKLETGLVMIEEKQALYAASDMEKELELILADVDLSTYTPSQAEHLARKITELKEEVAK